MERWGEEEVDICIFTLVMGRKRVGGGIEMVIVLLTPDSERVCIYELRADVCLLPVYPAVC